MPTLNNTIFKKKIAASQNVIEKNYWVTQLSGDTPFAQFPHDNIQGEGAPKKDVHQFDLNLVTYEKLMQVSKNSDYALQVYLLTVLYGLLYKYTSLNTLVIDTPIYQQLKEGDYINTVLPLRIELTGEKSFKELLMQVKQVMVEANQHSNYPIEFVLDELSPASTIHLTEIAIVLENIQAMSYLPEDKHNLIFRFNRSEKGLSCALAYNQQVFTLDTVKMLSVHFVRVIESVLQDVDVKLNDITIINETEYNQILNAFNDHDVPLVDKRMIYERIDEHARLSPNDVALVCAGERITYRELVEQSNQLARLLQTKGVAADQLVAVLCERSIDMIVGILAVWKAGGAYLPLDIDFPSDRLHSIISASKTRVLLTKSEFVHEMRQVLRTVETLNYIHCLDDKEAVHTFSKDSLSNQSKPSDLSYVIYTSGSTGKPKGVMIEHAGMMNHIEAMIQELQITNKSKIVQNANQCFDISVWQFFTALVTGGQTHIYQNDLILHPESFLRQLKDDRITILQVVPTYLSLLLDLVEQEQYEFPHLTYLLVTGEKVNAALVRRWFSLIDDVKVVNAYGPAEAADDVTLHIMDGVTSEKEIPVGKPIRNLKLYIVDENMKICPIGVKGEICVAGIGVGRGYVNDSEQTKQVFIDNPFQMRQERFYKTGDIGRWLSDGTIEYIGRKDDQVKIRGFRVELKEIESVLSIHPMVKEVVVIKKAMENEESLCAFFTTDERVDSVELRDYVALSLPYYMIPQFFIQLTEMPVNVNGKINKKELQNYDLKTSFVEENSIEELIGPFEQEILTVLGDVLSVSQIKIKDNFFNIGGDSIKAIQFSARLQKIKLFIDIKDIFQFPVMKDMVQHVRSLEIVIDQSPVEGEVTLTPIQKWFFESHRTNIHHHNQAALLFRRDRFREDFVTQVFEQMVEHHDALRIVYRQDSPVVQWNKGLNDHPFFELSTHAIENEANVYEQIIHHAEKIQQSLNLENGPLMKLAIFASSEGDYLFICIHHLVIDGISWRILFEDFEIGYQQLLQNESIEFQDKTDSFKKWSEKLNEYASTKNAQAELSYWTEIENSATQDLPTDFQQSDEELTYKENQMVLMELNEEYTDALLSKIHDAYNTEINDVLFTALSLALHQWAGLTSVMVNVEGHGRENIIENLVINRTIGWFTSQYPVVLQVNSKNDYGAHLKQTKENLRSIPNKGIGYGILRYLKNSGLGLKDPVINFNYLGQFSDSNDHAVFEIKKLKLGDPRSIPELGRTISDETERKFYLNIEGEVMNGKLVFSFGYNQKQYHFETMERLTTYFKEQLIQLIQHCLTKEDSEFTPSDYQYTNLSLEELDSIHELIEDLE
ncbi:amino acid adenylation domain-containing protein [Mesobacillus maritimus]|uniref:amino acid adenylation domain-containing protein n=1 Tax=Mesobacillus maritimus TaxID=1643336 RepID=UPI00203D885B|nr:amino acid adenylation domain-containing protein [Mesobacillus maritimus]MCM3670700.1 amino acid adenylation domain-containing protein [Mesobacillus maritimus]